ncbi:hypothetical protein AYO44_17400 [Planctomycetaceae bacterium SCGC AG-212-F19]|nr:hypothetical protein AYO44_17400 [Planctomycetaceae bacterium SCGC AG-212-F19]
MKAQAQKFGFHISQAKDRSHAFIQQVPLAPQLVEGAEVRQQCDVFIIRAKMDKMIQDVAKAVAWALC